MKKSYKIIFFFIIVLFLFTRFSGVDFIYHQDEHRWLLLADGTEPSSANPHPPMTLLLMKLTGTIFGFENMRILSLFFSLLNLGLIFLISNKIFNSKKAALTAVALFSLNIYSLVAGIQVDMDGAILPFFVLLGYYGYVSFLKENNKKYSLFLLSLAITGGLLTKASFVLFLAALFLDYLFIAYAKYKGNLRGVLKQVFKAGLPILTLLGLFVYFYSSRLGTIIDYAAHFQVFNFDSRAYLEFIFKVVKSFVWLSPLLTLPILLGLFIKEIRNRQRFWYLYFFVNFAFYLLVDFAKGPIERYFMFLVAPAAIISTDFLYYLFKKVDPIKLIRSIAVGVVVFSVFALVILSRVHIILPLNPKTAYVEYVRNLNFDFLIPFSSGSGPIGFYFSAQFILWSWIIAVLFLGGYAFIKNIKYKNFLLVLFFVTGLGYNIIFMNELLRGDLYGSPDKIARQTLNFVLGESSIKNVITYNDIAPYDLKKNNKHLGRFYTAPERDYTPKMSIFDGYYMIVDFPEIAKPGRYWDLIQRCDEIKRFTHKRVNSYVFDCRFASPIVMDKTP